MPNLLEELAAWLVTSPVFVFAYWAFFLRRLPADDRETVREARRSEEFRRQRAVAVFVAGAVVLGTSSSVRDVPFMVRLAAWAVIGPASHWP